MSSYVVGDRVHDTDGYKATVQYVGPVVAAQNKEEIWLGVEWDNPSRGKHDGSCVDDHGTLHRYFRCASTAGSFIRPAKISPGISLERALQERYVSLESEEIVQEGGVLPDSFVGTSKGNMKPIEFVGEKKLRMRQQLSSLLKASARNANVATIGDIRSIAGHLEELDLQDNLISNWQELVFLGEQVLGLQSLLLHGNKFKPLTDDVLSLLNSRPMVFQNVKVLALNLCNIRSWKTLQTLQPFLPSIEELYVAHNDLSDLPADTDADTDGDGIGVGAVSGFEQLRILDVTHCHLTSWKQVCCFGQLPSLQELILDYNELEQVDVCKDGDFRGLLRMSIAGSKLHSWASIDALSSYPQLHTLRLSQVPLFLNKGASEVRPIVIGRTGMLSVFNGSPVSLKERDTAEKIYLRSIYRELQAAGSQPDGADTSAVLALHPRYASLHAKYGPELVGQGDGAGGASGAAGQGNLSSEMLTITFRNFSFSSNGSLEPITKRLPKSLTLSKLHVLVQQLFGLEIHLQKLSLRTYKDAPPMVLEDEEATLQYYGAMDGAVIYVNE